MEGVEALEQGAEVGVDLEESTEPKFLLSRNTECGGRQPTGRWKPGVGLSIGVAGNESRLSGVLNWQLLLM